MLTYVAPWDPQENLYCGLGYGMALPPEQAVRLLLPYLGLRHPEVAARMLPWKENSAAADRYMRQWQQRDWQTWLGERLRFPFTGLVTAAARRGTVVVEVKELLPSTLDQARRMGVYLAAVADQREETLIAGASTILPLDITSPERPALAEYQAYREKVGRPPGTRGTPEDFEF
jgi:hypothetical protein